MKMFPAGINRNSEAKTHIITVTAALDIVAKCRLFFEQAILA